MATVFGGPPTGKTIAIDGKTVRGTGRLTKDGSALRIAIALVFEPNLVMGSVGRGTKAGVKSDEWHYYICSAALGPAETRPP